MDNTIYAVYVKAATLDELDAIAVDYDSVEVPA